MYFFNSLVALKVFGFNIIYDLEKKEKVSHVFEGVKG
jgi:hypothetical protein